MNDNNVSKEEKISDGIKKLARNWRILVALYSKNELSSKDLEEDTELAKSEISKGLTELRDLRIIDERRQSREGGGQPIRFAKLTDYGETVFTTLNRMTNVRLVEQETVPFEVEVAEWLNILQEYSSENLPSKNYELYKVMLYRLDKLTTLNPEACSQLVDKILEGIGKRLTPEYMQLFNILEKLAAKVEIIKKLKEKKHLEKFRLLASQWVEAAAKYPGSEDVEFTREAYIKLLSLLSTISGKESDEFMLDQFDKLRGAFDQGAHTPYIPLKYIVDRTWLFKELVKMLAEEQDKKKKELLSGLIIDFEDYVKHM